MMVFALRETLLTQRSSPLDPLTTAAPPPDVRAASLKKHEQRRKERLL